MSNKLQIQIQNNKGVEVVRISSKGETNYYPIRLNDLSMFNRLRSFHQETKTGNLVLNAWTNPNVAYAPINRSEMFTLSYLCVLYYLRLCDTRDMWRTFPHIPVKLLSYIRERAFFFENHLNYKIAILTCLHKGFDYRDVSKIMNVFRQCGLNENDYIYYLILLESEEYKNLEIDSDLLLNIRVIEQEIENFAEQPQTIRLCQFHANTKLSFIAKGSNLAIEELAMELRMNTIASYRLCRPMMSAEYSENFARRAMTNTRDRIIFSYTKHKGKINMWRSENEKGFVLRYTRLDDLTNNFDPTDINVMNSVGFTEDQMLENIEMRKVLDAKAVFATA